MTGGELYMAVQSRDELLEMIRDSVQSVFESRTRIPEDDHRAHHDWVREQISRQRARNEFWQSIAQKSLPVIVWTLFAAAATGVWKVLKSHVTWQ